MRFVGPCVLVLLAACGEPSESDTVPEASSSEARCVLESAEVVDQLDVSPSPSLPPAREVRDGSFGAFVGQVSTDGHFQIGRLEFTEIGEVRWLKWKNPVDGSSCGDAYAIDFLATFTTASGALDETFAGTVCSSTISTTDCGPPATEAARRPIGLTGFSIELPADALQGTLGIPYDPDDSWLAIRAEFDEGWRGKLVWKIQDLDGPWSDDLGSFHFTDASNGN